MNPATLFALEASIAHWERLASGNRQPNETTGSDHCALCHLFANITNCGDCPVAQNTGIDSCQNTPYANVYSAKKAHGLDSPQFKAAALEELKFLKSLLPDNHPSKSL